MRLLHSSILLALLIVPIHARAQVLGLPVVNSGAGSGIAVGADVGMSNADAGDFTSYGANASIGIGLIGVKGMLSRTSIQDETVTAKGAAATLRVFGGPLIPFRAMLQVGWGQWKVGDVTSTRLPISLGVAGTIPNPAFAIKPWIAPRLEFTRSAFGEDSDTGSHFGVSGGIELSLLNGLSLRSAYDRTFEKGRKPGILSFGLGFSL